eukprot:1157437-Pelagomonas_calceolata.AAC.1
MIQHAWPVALLAFKCLLLLGPTARMFQKPSPSLACFVAPLCSTPPSNGPEAQLRHDGASALSNIEDSSSNLLAFIGRHQEQCCKLVCPLQHAAGASLAHNKSMPIVSPFSMLSGWLRKWRTSWIASTAKQTKQSKRGCVVQAVGHQYFFSRVALESGLMALQHLHVVVEVLWKIPGPISVD